MTFAAGLRGIFLQTLLRKLKPQRINEPGRLELKKISWPWTRKKDAEEIGSIEAMLESVYTPVNARPAFVDDLRQKLVGVRGPLGVASRSTLELVLLIGGAIIGALVFGLIRIMHATVGMIVGGQYPSTILALVTITFHCLAQSITDACCVCQIEAAPFPDGILGTARLGGVVVKDTESEVFHPNIKRSYNSGHGVY